MTWRTGSWDFVSLDGVRLVGFVEKFGIAPMRNIESTPVPGLDGVDLKDQGYTGSPVNIGMKYPRSASFEAAVAQLAAINPRQPGIAIKPRKIEHPLARMANIQQVYILGYETDMPDDAGIWHVSISAFHFAKAKKVVAPLGGGALPTDADTKVPPNPAGYGANFTG